MNSFFKSLLSYKIDPLEDYESVLRQVLKWILMVLLIVGLPTVAMGVTEAIKLGQTGVAFIYVLLYTVLVLVAVFQRRLKFKLSTAFVLLCIYLFAVHNLVIYGFSGASIPIFLVFFLLITVFFGLKAGLWSLLAAIIPMAVVGYLMVQGVISVKINLLEISKLPVSWLTAASVAFLLGSLVVIVFSFIQNNLFHSVRIANNQADELRKVNESLKQEIQKKEAIQKNLEAAKEKAEESGRLKSAFLANMSHEIRTPMNGIIGFSQILQENDYPRDQQNEYLDIIHSRTQHLLHIINDLVDVSKIEANQLTLNVQHFYLNDLMQELYSVFSNELTNRGKDHIQLKLHLGLNDEESYFESDFNRFRQVMDNLLKNAVKFTEEGTVEFGYESQYEGSLLFYVKDSGVGIPNEQQKHIFERFRQVGDSTARTQEGTGLGLAISKNLVELLGGEMWLKSKEGEGSVFYFTLPYEGKPSKQSGKEKDSEGDISNKEEKTLLLIEDDPTSRDYMKALLEPHGLNLITCETGEEGYEAFINHPEIELVLMDIKLPDTNGLEVARKIRASSDKNREVPIIAQTAYAMSGDDKKSMEAGCNDYISKPVDKDELLEKIGKFF